MKRYVLPNGLELFNVHDESKCRGRVCVVHSPTDHAMSEWELHWREARGIFERICSHGVGHPDPDQFPFWVETRQMSQVTHGCDGCCGVRERPADYIGGNDD